MRILVTGGCGFIGHHFVEHLWGHTDMEVLVLDRSGFSARRLREVGRYYGGENIILADISQPLVSMLMHEIGLVDYIVHMAAESHVTRSIADPLPFICSNVFGTMHVLDYAQACLPRLKRFLYFSTDEVFGPAAEGESFGPWARYNSCNPYAATKAAGEELCLAWANTHKVPVAITHCMNVIGERQHPEKFLPKCIKAVREDRHVTIHTDAEGASAVRSWTPVDRVAAATLEILRHGGDRKWNIALGTEMSVARLAEYVGNVLAREARLEFTMPNDRPGNDWRYSVEPSEIPGLPPAEDFDTALRRIVKWYDANPEWLETY